MEEEDKRMIIVGIVVSVIVGVAAYFLLHTPTAPPSTPMEEREKVVPAIEHVAEKTGRMKEILHDDRMMIYVNGYSVSKTIDAPVRQEPMGTQFLIVDLSVMNMVGGVNSLSPNSFKLKTSLGEIMPSIYTTSINAGLRNIYLPNGQSIRTFVAFAAPDFGNTPIVLKYFDGTSSFSITLLNSDSPQSPLPSKVKPTFRIGESIHDDSLQLAANTTSISDIGNYTPKQKNTFLKITMNFRNIGKTSIHIDPSYIYVLDDKSYIYGIHESTSYLPSRLSMIDLEPGKSISGDVVIEVPKDSVNLVFMYAGPNNSLFARIV